MSVVGLYSRNAETFWCLYILEGGV